MNVVGQPSGLLELLFFPDGEEYWNEPDKYCTERDKTKLVRYYENRNILEFEASPFIRENGFLFRRPDFLTHFPDKAYVQVFRNLLENRHLLPKLVLEFHACLKISGTC